MTSPAPNLSRWLSSNLCAIVDSFLIVDANTISILARFWKCSLRERERRQSFYEVIWQRRVQRSCLFREGGKTAASRFPSFCCLFVYAASTWDWLCPSESATSSAGRTGIPRYYVILCDVSPSWNHSLIRNLKEKKESLFLSCLMKSISLLHRSLFFPSFYLDPTIGRTPAE